MMKKIGIVGGVGWPSTIEYYRLICEASQLYHEGEALTGSVPMPQISIESLDMNFTLSHWGSSEPGSWDKWDNYFNSALSRLVKNGAELLLVASATPHTRLNDISKGIDVPIISIYDSVAQHCTSNGIRNLLILGTMPTMNSPAFKNALHSFGINAEYPKIDAMKEGVVDVIQRLYQNKTDGAAADIEEIVKASVSANDLGNTAVCLGCTELPLAFQGVKNESRFEHNKIKYINSSVIHALSVFHACVT